jgi:hypothetical protein
MTWRRLGVLVAALPPESATKTALRDALTEEQLAELASTEMTGHGAWSHLEMLVAALTDRVGLLTWLNSDGKGKPPPPIRRPGVDAPKPRALSPAGVAYLEDIRRRHREQSEGA